MPYLVFLTAVVYVCLPGCSSSPANMEISCDQTLRICYRGFRIDRQLTLERYGSTEGIQAWRDMYGRGSR